MSDPMVLPGMTEGLNQALGALEGRVKVLETATAEASTAPAPDAAAASAATADTLSMLVALVAPNGMHRCVDGVRTWDRAKCFACGGAGG